MSGTLDLFADLPPPPPHAERLGPGTVLLHGYALERAPALIAAVERIIAASPWRQMITPGGQTLAVSMSNCGPLGWVTDRQGYRYAARDPEREQPWPPMPEAL